MKRFLKKVVPVAALIMALAVVTGCDSETGSNGGNYLDRHDDNRETPSAENGNHRTNDGSLFGGNEGERSITGGIAQAANTLAVMDAFSNTGYEIMQRINGSPFAAAVMLAENLEYGTLTTGFSYRDDMQNMRVDGNVTLHTDARSLNNQRVGVTAEVSVPILGAATMDLDAAFFMTNDWAALGSSMLGPEFYGVQFDTLHTDFQDFARLMGAGEQDIAMAAGVIEAYVSALRQGAATQEAMLEQSMDLFVPYLEILGRFMADAEVSPADAVISVNGRDMNVRRFAYEADFRDIMELAERILTMLETDPNLRNLIFEMYANPFGDNPFWNDMMMDMGVDMADFADMIYSEFQQALREARNEVRGVMADMPPGTELNGTAAFYVANNRLVRIGLGLGGQIPGEGDVNAEINMDFGASVTDRWSLSALITQNFGGLVDEQDMLIFTWDYSVAGSRHIQTVNVMPNDPWSSATLVSNWDAANGEFTLSMSDGWNTHSYSGNFQVQGTGFTLELGAFDFGWGQSLALTFSSSRGANIPDVNFINIDSWDMELVNTLEEIIMTFAMF